MKKSRERVLPLLRDLLGDPTARMQAARALGRLKAVEYRAEIESLGNDPSPDVASTRIRRCG